MARGCNVLKECLSIPAAQVSSWHRDGGDKEDDLRTGALHSRRVWFWEPLRQAGQVGGLEHLSFFHILGVIIHNNPNWPTHFFQLWLSHQAKLDFLNKAISVTCFALGESIDVSAPWSVLGRWEQTGENCQSCNLWHPMTRQTSKRYFHKMVP